MVHIGAILPPGYRTVSVQAHSVQEILAQLRHLADSVAAVMDSQGDAAGALALRRRGADVVAGYEARMAAVAALVAPLPRRRVLCLEWLDPFFNAGHWVPELVERAGGHEVLGSLHRDSVRMTWAEVVTAQPDVIVALPCSFGLERAIREAATLVGRPGLESIPAVRQGEVWAVDAERYFSGSSPRVIDGMEILAALLYPAAAGHLLPAGAAVRVSLA